MQRMPALRRAAIASSERQRPLIVLAFEAEDLHHVVVVAQAVVVAEHASVPLQLQQRQLLFGGGGCDVSAEAISGSVR